MPDKDLVNALVIDELKLCFKTFGIERTEEIFRSAFANNQKLLEVFQANYNKLLKG